jgi:hypothetical protein
MTTHISEELLSDLADGELGSEHRASALAHVEACPQCRRELEAIRSIKADLAALPKEQAPARDLWPGIRGRLEASARSKVDLRAAEVIPVGTRRRLVPLAVAAGLVLVAGASILFSQRTAHRATPERAHRGETHALEIAPGEKEYGRALEELRRDFDQRRSELRPETVEVVEQNLRLIDQAIVRTREALATDPGSPDLTLLLSSAYEMEIELLRQANDIAQEHQEAI